MDNTMLLIANSILKNGQEEFNPSNYAVEYRKNKTVKDIEKILQIINKKNRDFESNVTILYFGLNSVFKKMLR